MSHKNEREDQCKVVKGLGLQEGQHESHRLARIRNERTSVNESEGKVMRLRWYGHVTRRENGCEGRWE